MVGISGQRHQQVLVLCGKARILGVHNTLHIKLGVIARRLCDTIVILIPHQRMNKDPICLAGV